MSAACAGVGFARSGKVDVDSVEGFGNLAHIDVEGFGDRRAGFVEVERAGRRDGSGHGRIVGVHPRCDQGRVVPVPSLELGEEGGHVAIGEDRVAGGTGQDAGRQRGHHAVHVGVQVNRGGYVHRAEQARLARARPGTGCPMRSRSAPALARRAWRSGRPGWPCASIPPPAFARRCTRRASAACRGHDVEGESDRPRGENQGPGRLGSPGRSWR